jgi:WD40 repeat protein
MSARNLRVAEDIGAEIISPLVSESRITLPANATQSCFSNDGSICAVALGDGSVALVDPFAETDEAPPTVDLHRIAAVAIRPLGDGFVSAGQDGRVVAFFGADRESATEICAFPDRWIENLAVHEVTGRVAVAAGDEVAVFDRQGALLARFPKTPGTVSCVAVDNTGNRIAASHYNGVTIFNLETGASDLTLDWKGSHIGVSWSPNGRFLVTATQEKELHIWDLVTMQDFRMGGYPRKIHQMSWTADSEIMGCSGADVITAWSFADAGPGRRPPVEIGFVFGGNVTAVAAHPSRSLFAGGFSSGNVLVGATRKGEAIVARGHTGTPVTTLAWSPDGKRFAAADGAGLLSLFTVPDELGVS